MKLTLLKPVIFEAFDDDEFANTPHAGQDLVAALKQREKAIKHEYIRVYRDNTEMASAIPNHYAVNAFPGGHKKLAAALADKSWVRVSNDVVVPNTAVNQPLIQQAMATYQRFQQLANAKVAMHNKILVAQGSASAYVSQSIDKPTTEQIPETQVPAQISSGKGKFRNPYFLSNVGRYAGVAENFPWTPHMHKMYVTVKDILDKNGVPGFTVAYGSTFVDPVRQGASLISCSNFAVIGASGKFVWRKYDLGGGSGQNWVYVDGEKMNTTRFILFSGQSDPKAQAQFASWIAALK
jgi:hypothetical protein